MKRTQHANDKAPGVLVGYARVSTAEQSLAMQREALTKAGVEPHRIHVDTASGVAAKRPGLAAALLDCVEGDTLVVWKLDRLGRSMIDLLNQIAALEDRGVRFRSITEGLDTTTAAGRLLMHVIGALAEFERGLIRERTLAGVAAARARGVKFGPSRKFSEDEADKLFREGRGVAEVSRMLGLSRNALYRYYTAERIAKLQAAGRRKLRRQP